MPVPIPAPTAMNPGAPIAVFLAVTLSAQSVGLLEEDRLTAGKVKDVPVSGLVAVETPAVLLIVREDDVGVEAQLPASGVDWEHPVAVGAGVDPCRKRRRRDLYLLLPKGHFLRSASRESGGLVRFFLLAAGGSPKSDGQEDRQGNE